MLAPEIVELGDACSGGMWVRGGAEVFEYLVVVVRIV